MTYLVKGSYVRIFDVNMRDGTVQESAKDTRIAVSRWSTLDFGQFRVCASRLPRIYQLLHRFSSVEIFFRFGRKVPHLVGFFRLCIVLLSWRIIKCLFWSPRCGNHLCNGRQNCRLKFICDCNTILLWSRFPLGNCILAIP